MPRSSRAYAEQVLEALAALVPSIGVGLLFWFVVRAMIAGDRRERAAMAALDREERADQVVQDDSARRPRPEGPAATE